MAGNSRDLNVNLVGKSDKLKFGDGGTRTIAAGVTIGNLLSKGITKGLDLVSQAAGQALTQALGTQDMGAQLQASLGLSPERAAEYGQIASNAYLDGWGSTVGEAGSAVEAFVSTFQEGLGGDASLEALTGQALAFAQVFQTDVPTAVNAAGRLFESGLADNAQEAFDLMTAGMQQMPVALRGELLDATHEYSQFFGALGIDGAEAFGLLVDASADGQYGIDKMGDAIKEFTIRATDGSALTQGAFDAIGLDMDDLSNQILAGGDSARGAFDQIIDGLLGIEDPTQQANAAIALFGTPLEDLGTGEIPQFLQGLADMDDALQNVDGSTQELADTMGGTASAKFEAFKRQGIQKLLEGFAFLSDFIGENGGLGGALKKALSNLGGWWQDKGKDLLNGLWVGIQAYWDSTVLPWLKTLPGLALEGLGIVGGFLVDKGAELLNGLWQGIQKVWDDPILPWLKSLPGLALKGLGALGSFLLDKGKDLLDGLWQGIQSVWDSTILPWLKDLPGLALKGVGALGSTLLSKGRDLLGGLGSGIANVWDNIVKPWLADLPGKAIRAVPSLIETLLSRGKQLLNGLKDGVIDVWNNTLKPWLADLGTKALLAVPSLIDKLASRGKQLLNGVKNGVLEVWNDTLKPWLADLGTQALLAVPALLGTLTQRGKDLLIGLKNGAISAMGGVTTWLAGMPGRISGWFANAGSWLLNAGRNIVSGLWNGFWGGVTSIIPSWARGFLGIGGGSTASMLPGMAGNSGGGLRGGGGGGTGSPLYLHDGGVVPGRLGTEVLAVLQAGEEVVPIGGGRSYGDDEDAGARDRGDRDRGGVHIDNLHVGSTADLPLVEDSLGRVAFLAKHAA